MLSPDFASHLARRFSTPLYVYSAEEIEARHVELRRVLPPSSELLFSLKANPLPGIASLLCDGGCHAEVSSAHELAVARRAGFDPARTLYTGPVKTADEVRAAMVAGVGYFSCESVAEIDGLAALGSAQNGLLLRINPPPPSPQLRTSGLSMSSPGRQFGFTDLDVSALRTNPALKRVVGVHVYQGTQIDSPALPLCFAGAAAAANNVCQDLGLTPRVIDLGGGFPWPFAVTAPGPDLAPARDALAEIRRGTPISTGLWFEAGRFLTASSGVLLATVQRVRRATSGPYQVILDTGINHLGGMSGLRRIPSSRPELVLAKRGESQDRIEVDVFGPLCTPLDCLARGLSLPRLPDRGELVSVPNVGAYGLTASLYGFLSRPPPVEVIVRGERILEAYRLRTGHDRLSDLVAPETVR